MGQVHAGLARHGTAVFTTVQTRGRGQRSKEWLSEPGKNVAVSFVLEPAGLSVSHLFLLSKAVANAACRVFNKYVAGEARIKWPNDIYWRDRKAVGILVENVIKAREWMFAVAGIGINVNQTAFGAMQQKAVSLKQITGKDYNPRDVAMQLAGELDHEYRRLLEEPDEIRATYASLLYKRNEQVRFRCQGRIFEAVVKGVSDQGQLIVEHGVEERFDVGAIEWLAG
jgi:BirA family transcriptional regulator, biotin operon repressor / biotin---[acetyl-CoA-carboxylase] ligase